MWNFKLKKTRIIFVISVLWFLTCYFIIGFQFNEYFAIGNVMTRIEFYIILFPIYIYWIVIPSYRWMLKGK